ncbi:ThiF family adenylyltransferase [Patescibacteria group bacterium]
MPEDAFQARLKSLLKETGESLSVVEPLIFDLGKADERRQLERLLQDDEVIHANDYYIDQLSELMEVQNPESIGQRVKINDGTDFEREGKWIYFPWGKKLSHILNESEYKLLRSSRNMNLVTKDEQVVFEKMKIAFTGLNVGNPGALCISLEGGGNSMKFADNDHLSLSNLNRFRASISDLGVNKAVLSARQVYEINPYAEIDIYDQGISEENIEAFLLSPKVDLLVEEMDHLPLKVKIRKKAKEYKIPVIMVTGNGENVIIDVERYDIDNDLEILNGTVNTKVIERVETLDKNKICVREYTALCRDFIGADNLAERLQDSFQLIGSELAGIPQLAESSFLRGAVISYFARQIATSASVPSGRYYLNMDSMIESR